VYEGPQLIGQINKGLVRLMKRDGFSSVTLIKQRDSALTR
jgi:dihydroorotate dehydrogenase